MLFVTNHVQNKNWIDFSVILIWCRSQQAFDWTLNTLMLYFRLRRIRNGVCALPQTPTICETTKSNLQLQLDVQAKGIHLGKLSSVGTQLNGKKASHARIISMHPFPSKFDFNLNAEYEKKLVSTFLLSNFRLSWGPSVHPHQPISQGSRMELCSPYSGLLRFCFLNPLKGCLLRWYCWTHIA